VVLWLWFLTNQREEASAAFDPPSDCPSPMLTIRGRDSAERGRAAVRPKQQPIVSV